MNGFDANVMKPVLKEIVFLGKAIADIKNKIINHDPERIIRKANATVIRDTVIFAVNMKLMKVVIAPALHNLKNNEKRGQWRTSCDPQSAPDHGADSTNSDFDDVDLHRQRVLL